MKSSAYIQGWGQRALTRIYFGLLVKLVWDGATGAWIGEPRLNADWYVFALEICRDGSAYNPHDLAQWRFYVVSRGALEGLKKGKGLSLARVAALATPMTAEELRRDGTAMMGLQTRP